MSCSTELLQAQRTSVRLRDGTVIGQCVRQTVPELECGPQCLVVQPHVLLYIISQFFPTQDAGS